MSESIVKPSNVPLVANNGNDDEVVPFSPPSGSLANFQGELRPEYRRSPYLSIIQAVGDSSAKFPRNHGDILYNKEKIVPKPANLVFFGLRVFYSQNLAYDANSTIRPMTYRTAEEVIEHGGNLNRGVRPGSDDHNYVPQALAFCVLESPAKKGWAAGIEQSEVFESKILVPATWFLRGVAFNRICDKVRLVNNALRKAGKELAHARFTLDTVHQPINGNWIYVPVLIKSGETNADSYVAALKELFGE
jgi:hypothetical protein